MGQGVSAANILASPELSAPSSQKAGGWWIALSVVITLAVGYSAWWMAQRTIDPDSGPEIAVLVSRSNTTTWPRLVQSMTAAAETKGWSVPEATSEQPGRLRIAFGDAGAVTFRLYKELGHAGMRQRVVDLCERRQPPIAILSGANSGSGRVVAEALRDREKANGSAPVYLLTSATVDDLTQIHAGKTFRFGHRNSRQAKEVVVRMAAHFRDRGFEPPAPKAVVVEIEDDPFACEFARLVRLEMVKAFGAERVEFESRQLPTEFGLFDDATELERRNAKWLASEMAMSPTQPWVVVLPAGADAYRRFLHSLYEALHEVGADRMALHFDNLTFVAGDSVDFGDFMGPLKPTDLHAAMIFYAQYDPRAIGSQELDPVRIKESLYHEIAGTLADVLADPNARRSSGELQRALAAHRPSKGGETYFDDAERRSGGGAVVVRSSVDSKFQFEFPKEMK